MTDRNTSSDQDVPTQADAMTTDTPASAVPAATAAQEPPTDDWASALAEQTESAQQTEPAAQAEPAPAAVFAPLTGSSTTVGSDIDLIMDVPVQLSVELGRTRMAIKNLLQLGQGSVIELNSLAGEPMDVYVNGYLIAQGEVVVVEDRYGIRLTDIVTPAERISRLNTQRFL